MGGVDSCLKVETYLWTTLYSVQFDPEELPPRTKEGTKEVRGIGVKRRGLASDFTIDSSLDTVNRHVSTCALEKKYIVP